MIHLNVVKRLEGQHCLQGSDISSVRPCRTWCVRGAGGAGGVGYCSARVLSARFDLPALCIESALSQDVRCVLASSTSAIEFDLVTLNYTNFFRQYLFRLLVLCWTLFYICVCLVFLFIVVTVKELDEK